MTRATRPLRVCIDARVLPSRFGGVASFITGLAHGLSALTDGDEQYFFLTRSDWVRERLGDNCSILSADNDGGPTFRRRVARKLPRIAKALRAVKGYASSSTSRTADVLTDPQSEKAIRSADIDVMHFTYQRGFKTDIPSIYHPHDLQHRHLPNFFTPDEITLRDYVYRTMCERSKVVAVASEWVKADLVTEYGLPAAKIAVVPMAPPLDAYSIRGEHGGDPDSVRKALGVPERFLLYPAATWPHKNHIRLLQTLAINREYGYKIHLACSGRLTPHFDRIQEVAQELNVEDQVTFVGFITPNQLVSLYVSAQAVIVPTLFEAASFPIWEAFSAGKPVACSNVTSLPEQVGDAALIFDPEEVTDIARSIQLLWTNEELRLRLATKARQRVRSLSWDTTARTFRAHYRLLGNRSLSAEDQAYVESTYGLASPYDGH